MVFCRVGRRFGVTSGQRFAVSSAYSRSGPVLFALSPRAFRGWFLILPLAVFPHHVQGFVSCDGLLLVIVAVS